MLAPATPARALRSTGARALPCADPITPGGAAAQALHTMEAMASDHTALTPETARPSWRLFVERAREAAARGARRARDFRGHDLLASWPAVAAFLTALGAALILAGWAFGVPGLTT